jgi:hypothetical protein
MLTKEQIEGLHEWPEPLQIYGDATMHQLKVHSEFWGALISGEKTFELRKDDRGFKAGDLLLLCEYSQLKGYSGNTLVRRITYILSGQPWLTKDYVAMALVPAASAGRQQVAESGKDGVVAWLSKDFEGGDICIAESNLRNQPDFVKELWKGAAPLVHAAPTVAIASPEGGVPVELPAGATKHDWTEDWPHENGMYYCRCHQCDNTFFGYKRRIICKACSSIPPVSEGTVLPRKVAPSLKAVAWLVENCNGKFGEHAGIDLSVVLSPLTDDTYLGEGDQAHALCKVEDAEELIARITDEKNAMLSVLNAACVKIATKPVSEGDGK